MGSSVLGRLAAAAIVIMPLAAPDGPTATPGGVTARPVPAIAGHALTGLFTSPPTTAYCRLNLGISCYQPFQLQKAYDLAPLLDRGVDGRGRTIVLVDAFGSPTIEHDLQVFDRTLGLPDPPSFTIIQPAGRVPPFPQDPFGAFDRSLWAAETTLDVEWSHAMAPAANVLLVETPQSETEGVQGFPEIVDAENFVIDHDLGDVISQSFGATEQTFPSPGSILSLRSAYLNARRHHVTVLASSGDQGATNLQADVSCCYPFRVISWPSADPLVTSLGGTQLHLDDAGSRVAPDTVWNDGFGAGGGGLSQVFQRPAFQNAVRDAVDGRRGAPDVSMSAAVDGGVDVFYSFTDYSAMPPVSGPQWRIFGGTSEASPLFAGVVALADQLAGRRLGYLNDHLYQLAEGRDRGMVDVTAGDNSFTFCSSSCGTPDAVITTVPGFAATRGYDLASGLGTVDAGRLAPALVSMGEDGGSG